MSITYYYYVGTPVNIVALVAALNSDILNDLDLPVVSYISTVYNALTENVEITFSTTLNDYNLYILNALTEIILFNNTDSYYRPQSSNDRMSTSVTNNPNVNNDYNSGYTPGSIVTTSSNNVFINTNNTIGNAVWVKLNDGTGPTGSTGPIGIQGPTGPHGLTGPLSSVLGELSATGSYTWTLTKNVTYILGTTSPTTNLVTVFSPSPNSYWQPTASDRLQYIGTNPISVNVFVSINFSTSVTSKSFIFNIVLNNNPVSNTTILFTTPNTNSYVISYNKVIPIVQNDTLAFSLLCNSSGGAITTMRYFNISAIA